MNKKSVIVLKYTLKIKQLSEISIIIKNNDYNINC